MLIQSRNVYFEEKLQPLQIEIENGYIKNVFQYGQFAVDKDYEDFLILPGLIDTHVHGWNKGSVFEANKKWLEDWCDYLPQEGITSVVAGISCYPKDVLLNSLSAIGEQIDSPTKGAHIVAVYEEGPFISLGKEKGAQKPEFCIIPTKEVIDEFNNACHGHLKYVMIAPDMLNDDYSVIDYCKSLGMAVAIGHSGADFLTASKAIEHGANSFTHTYNGMTGLHHREPGVVGAAMYFENTYAELISDGIHVEKHAANILARLKGKDHLIIVTDSISMKGLPVGDYYDENTKVTTSVCIDGVCRLANGTLAGSVRKLNDNLRFAIKEAGIDYVTAINACTINPMNLLNINNKGLIKPGYIADLVVFNDNFETQATYIDGKIHFSK